MSPRARARAKASQTHICLECMLSSRSRPKTSECLWMSRCYVCAFTSKWWQCYCVHVSMKFADMCLWIAPGLWQSPLCARTSDGFGQSRRSGEAGGEQSKFLQASSQNVWQQLKHVTSMTFVFHWNVSCSACRLSCTAGYHRTIVMMLCVYAILVVSWQGLFINWMICVCGCAVWYKCPMPLKRGMKGACAT